MQHEFLAAGHCVAPEALARRGGAWRSGRFDGGFSLISTEAEGPMLFDTGYAGRVLPALSRYPFSVLGRLLPVTVAPEDEAIAQLLRRGMQPNDVRTVIVSHFHTDHIGGLRDFPAARIVCSRQAWLAVRDLRGWAAMRRSFIPELLPEDFAERIVFAEDLPPWPVKDGWGGWLIAEGLRLVPLPGHATGQIGLWIESLDIFLIADAAWRRSSLATGHLPHPLAMRIQDDPAAYRQTFARLTELQESRPGLHLIPSHDEGPC